MARNSALTVSVGIIAAVMICVAASQASDVFAPLALALFIIALIWPMQSWLQARMPALLALAITMTVTVAVCVAFASLVAWAFGRVGVFDRRHRTLPGDLRESDRLARRPRDLGRRPMERAFQRRLAPALGRTDHRPRQHDLELLADRPPLRHPSPDGSRRPAPTRSRLPRPEIRSDPAAGQRGDGGEDPQVHGSAHADERRDRRSRRRVRLGRWIALCPRMGRDRLRAQLHSVHRPLRRDPVSHPGGDDSVRVVGSRRRSLRLPQHHPVRGRQRRHVEPRVSGAMLAMSPTVVLLAVFLWTYLWGLFGAFIGVPIVIAIVTFCAYHPSSRWIADLLGGPVEKEAVTQGSSLRGA